MSPVVQVFGRRNAKIIDALWRPASENLHKWRFQEAKRERSIITCKPLSADARLRLTPRLASTVTTGGFRDELAGLCNSISARAYPELRLRSRANRPQHERRRAD